ncbi:unnamed protein product [Ceutorhynchus assimilis]|uniref:DUF4806 domain-containing protein n=1 Tax=Ceutorhynchus assimilis TaxID=467358 RepID=A0A9N9MVR0_9CUCU|nr:unnamed protein product [Ceutorhynchus assimilis]
MENKQWNVVKFNNEDEGDSVEVVPLSWITGTDCFWPPFDNRRDVESAMKHCSSPKENSWRKYTGVQSSSRTYDKFATASSRANKVIANSEIDSSGSEKLPKKRLVKMNPLYAKNYFLNSNETSEDEAEINVEIPKFPTLSTNTKLNKGLPSKKASKGLIKTNGANTSGVTKNTNEKKLDYRKSHSQKVGSNSSNNELPSNLAGKNNAVQEKIVFEEDCEDEEYLPCDDEHISDSEASSISSKHDSQTVDDKNVLHSKKANRTDAAALVETDELDNNNSSVLKKLVRQTIINNKLIKKQNAMLKELISKLNVAGLNNMDPDEEVLSQQFKNTFPIKEDENLDSTNQILSEEEKFYKYALKMVSLEGGHSVSECVRKVMTVVIDDNLANSYSFKGHKAKKNFSKYKHLVSLIIDSVRSHVPTATTKEMQDQIAIWLTQSRRRMEAAVQD